MIRSATEQTGRSLGHLVGETVHRRPGTFAVDRPPARRSPCAPWARARTSTRPSPPPARRSRPGRRSTRRSARAILHALARLIEEHADELAETESRDVGKPIAEASTRDLPFTIGTWSYYAGWPTKILGTTNPAAPGRLHRHAARAARRRRRRSRRGTSRSRSPRGRSRRRWPAGTRSSTSRRRRRRSPRSGWPSSRSRPGVPPGVLNVVTGDAVDRRRARRAPGRRRALVHRLDRRRAGDPARGGREHEAAHARAGREVGQHRARRRRHGRRAARRRLLDVPKPGRDLHGGRPAGRGARPPPDRWSSGWPSTWPGSGSGAASTPRRRWARSSPRATGDGCSTSSTRRAAEGAEAVGRRRPGERWRTTLTGTSWSRRSSPGRTTPCG